MECKCVNGSLVVAGATSADAGNKKGKRKEKTKGKRQPAAAGATQE